MLVALLRTIEREIFWSNHTVSKGSPDASITFLPNSSKKLLVEGPQQPVVSNATGWKWKLPTKPLYLRLFNIFADFALNPDSMKLAIMWDLEKASTTVASQTKHFPCFQGKVVMPSERRPLPLSSPDGSRMLSKPIFPRHLLIMKLKFYLDIYFASSRCRGQVWFLSLIKFYRYIKHDLQILNKVFVN